MAGLAPLVKRLRFLDQKAKAPSKGPSIRVMVIGRGAKAPQAFYKEAPASAKAKIKRSSSVTSWTTNSGSYWLLQLKVVDSKTHYGMFAPSAYAMARDLVGTCFRQMVGESPKRVSLEYIGESEEELRGLAVGIEMAQYHFKKVWPEADPLECVVKFKSSLKNYQDVVEQGALLGEATNFSRFLVDLPPNLLQPKNYADLLQGVFAKKAKTKVTVWDKARLEKEKMGLHVAVGQAAAQEPQMVHIEYRGGGKEEPIAFVGKGITFDAGGLDIKPSAGMRLMKKDMGGSASVAGIAYWAVQSRLKLNCDFYFAIAENSVGEDSFRPGDVLTARSGLTVEIHNTDAEGRLVLGDVLTLAAEKKPRFLIDIATLTGAIKYGLGSSTPGLFSNDDNLAECLLRAGQRKGDISWRMPLIPEERSRLKSEVADVANCANGYGGAITAALFLEMFTGGIPWAHFDIYAWMESAKGPYASSGGSGQVVQAVADFLHEEALNALPDTK